MVDDLLVVHLLVSPVQVEGFNQEYIDYNAG
jgi:hypothetical protein